MLFSALPWFIPGHAGPGCAESLELSLKSSDVIEHRLCLRAGDEPGRKPPQLVLKPGALIANTTRRRHRFPEIRHLPAPAPLPAPLPDRPRVSAKADQRTARSRRPGEGGEATPESQSET